MYPQSGLYHLLEARLKYLSVGCSSASLLLLKSHFLSFQVLKLTSLVFLGNAEDQWIHPGWRTEQLLNSWILISSRQPLFYRIDYSL